MTLTDFITTIRAALYIYFISTKKTHTTMDDKENLLLTDIDEGIPAKDQIEEKREDKVDIKILYMIQ